MLFGERLYFLLELLDRLATFQLKHLQLILRGPFLLVEAHLQVADGIARLVLVAVQRNLNELLLQVDVFCLQVFVLRASLAQPTFLLKSLISSRVVRSE